MTYHTHLQTDYKINLRQQTTCFSQSTFAKNRFARFMCHGFLHGCAYKCLASARRENQRSKNAYMHSAARSEWIARLLRRGLKLTLREDAFCSGRCKACVSQGSERARCQVRRKAEADAGQYAERCQRGVQQKVSLRAHPDKGGEKTDFQNLSNANDSWQEALQNKGTPGRPSTEVGVPRPTTAAGSVLASLEEKKKFR